MSDGTSKRRVVIGGGISGLAAACRLMELAPQDEVLLLEAAPRLGGVLETIGRDGYLIEQSADNFITDVTWGVDFCRRVHMPMEELIPTIQGAARRALVVHNGRLEPVPEGFMLLAPARLWPVLKSPLLSLRGKLRVACEPFVKQRPAQAAEETLEEFATRRLGREAYERIAAPLVAAIYGGDPAQLSVAAALPRFVDMEREHGSLLRAARKLSKSRQDATAHCDPAGPQGDVDSSGARYGLFMAPRGGMSSLIEFVAARLPPQSIRLSATVTKLEKRGNAWELRLAGASEPLLADGVILATPIRAAAELLAGLDAEAAQLCRSVASSSCAVVSLGYDVGGTGFVPPGFGFVVPAGENRPILAVSFASAKFPHRAPEGHVLVRVFMGGAGHEADLALPDDELVQIAVSELDRLAGLRGQPVLSLVRRWPMSMPQYHVGHAQRMQRLQLRVAALGNLALAGNAYRGVGIPHCIHSGELAAEAVVRK